jgi:hypothetical protein
MMVTCLRKKLFWKGKFFLFFIYIYLLFVGCYTNTMYSKKFQTIMASATLHNGIRQLAFVALHKPIYIGLKPQAVSEFGNKSTFLSSVPFIAFSLVSRSRSSPYVASSIPWLTYYQKREQT